MQKDCKQCGKPFEVTENDLKFYDKISPVFNGNKYGIPAPTLCIDCKWQRKMVWRNFYKFYNKKSDLSGKPLISVYSSDKPLKVYTNEEWWSDRWNPLDYGRDFDFNRPFFEQFKELHDAVPKQGTNVSQSENCEYTNATYSSKDCYLVAGCIQNENCYFSHILWYSKNCFEMLYSYHCEQCYECIDCDSCYGLRYSRECIGCSNSYYLIDCRSCDSCFGCVGLTNKKFYIFNKPYTQEEYNKLLPELLDPKNAQRNAELFQKLYEERPKRAIFQKNAENVNGNRIFNSRNLEYCFDMINSEDSKYCFTAGKFKDCYDCIHNGGGLEIGYETFASVGYNLLFTRDSFGPPSSFLLYCSDCMSVSNCFGCVGLHSKEQYCVLNKKYTKEQYEILVSRIIEHMQKTGEWGEYFPVTLSPFGYNETTANEFYPLTKQQALAYGTKWRDEDAVSLYQGPKIDLPDDILKVSDEITKTILECKNCRHNYKIIPQELSFYRKMNIALPKNCFDCRHRSRLAKRNPRKLWERQCAKCAVAVKTSYAPERPATATAGSRSDGKKVYCEGCYLKEVY